MTKKVYRKKRVRERCNRCQTQKCGKEYIASSFQGFSYYGSPDSLKRVLLYQIMREALLAIVIIAVAILLYANGESIGVLIASLFKI